MMAWLTHMRALLNSSRDGHCGMTTEGSFGDCGSGDRGAFGLAEIEALLWSTAISRCVQLCAACARCRFASISIDNKDCSWYSECAGFSRDRQFKTIELPSPRPLLLSPLTGGVEPADAIVDGSALREWRQRKKAGACAPTEFNDPGDCVRGGKGAVS